MTNEIIGQSRDNKSAIELINSIGIIGEGIKKISETLGGHENRLKDLEDTMRVNGVQEHKLTKSVNQVVITALGGKESAAYLDKSIRAKAYSECNRRIKEKYGIPRRAELPAKEYESCIAYIQKQWSPDYDLKQSIHKANGQQKLSLVN